MGRDEVLERCSGTQNPLSSPVVGDGCAWVTAPPVPWCRALVATGVVRHQFLCNLTKVKHSSGKVSYDSL